MNKNIEEDVVNLRSSGYGYKKIAALLGICRDDARHYCKKNGLNGANASYTLKCKVCGGVFESSSPNTLYCSETCRYKAHYISKQTIELKQCKECGNLFVPKKTFREIYCSDECRKDARNRRDREKRKHVKKISNAKHVKLFCPTCGKEFITRNAAQKYCSKKCGKKYRGDGRIYRVSKDERLKQCVQNDKSLWLQPLIKRDNNTCQICGRKCDLYDYEVTASGAMICGDRYPTIDHIVPLSKGGQHIWANAQLACRKCNREKGADD